MIKGMLNVALVLLGVILLREALLSEGPDHYMYPRTVEGKTVYDRSEDFNPTYLPMNSDKTFILFAVSKRHFYTLQKWNRNVGTESVTTVSRVNFRSINHVTCSVFSDGGYLHVLTPTNDTILYQKNTINWLPESLKLQGDSIVVSNDTARVTLATYRK